MHAQRTPTGWPTMPPGYETRRYDVGFRNYDGTLTTIEVEAQSLHAAEEAAIQYMNETIEIVAEEIEEEEPFDAPASNSGCPHLM